MDPAARRPAVVLVAIGGSAGAAMLLAFQAYREPLQEWLLSDPAQLPARARLLIAGVGALLVFPLWGFAAYIWTRSATIDAPRARGLEILAAILVACSLLLAVTLWRLSVFLTSSR